MTAIGGCIHEGLDLVWPRGLQDDHPPRPVRILVHQLWLVCKGLVDLDDLPTHRREDLAHRLDGFDCTEGLPLLDRLAYRRQLDVHDIGQLALREVRDPDPGPCSLGLGPLVVLRVAEPIRNFRQRNPN